MNKNTVGTGVGGLESGERIDYGAFMAFNGPSEKKRE